MEKDAVRSMEKYYVVSIDLAKFNRTTAKFETENDKNLVHKILWMKDEIRKNGWRRTTKETENKHGLERGKRMDEEKCREERKKTETDLIKLIGLDLLGVRVCAFPSFRQFTFIWCDT